ncbi:MAG: hypothetical protein R3Y11_05030 [Pseudomonadota bacterium]
MAKKNVSFAAQMKAMARKVTQIDAAVKNGDLDSSIFSGSPDSWKMPNTSSVTADSVEKQILDAHPEEQLEEISTSNCSLEPLRVQSSAVETEQVTMLPAVVQCGHPSNTPSIRNRTQETPWFPRTKMQKELASYLQQHGQHITTLGIICVELSVGISTLRNLLRTFRDKGLVQYKKHYGEDGKQGLYIEAVNLTNIPSSYEEAILGVKKEPHKTNIQTSMPQRPTTEIANEVIPRDKQKESLPTTATHTSPLLKLSKEDILFYWPDLAKIDFGPSQISQIYDKLTKLGRVIDAELTASITQGLTHANAALAFGDGTLRDHKGNPIANPRAYVFIALARDGYYTAPKGYLSPQACRLRDKAEQNRLFLEAQKELKAQEMAIQEVERENVYSQWRNRLSEEELSDLRLKAPSHAKKGVGFEKWLKLSYYPELES